MASASKRISTSSIHSRRSASPVSIRFAAAPNAESEEWLRVWESTTVQGTWYDPQSTRRTNPGWRRPPELAPRAAGVVTTYLTDAKQSYLALVENPVVAVESEIAVEEACDVNLIRPHPVFPSALCACPPS